MNWKIFAVVIFISIILSTVVYGAYNYYVNIDSTGNVEAVNIEIYWDSERTNKVENINWGNISPTETKIVTIFIYNSGSDPVYLQLNSKDWYPIQVEDAMILDWNYDNNSIAPSKGIFVNISLTMVQPLEDTTISNFNYTTIISAYN